MTAVAGQARTAAITTLHHLRHSEAQGLWRTAGTTTIALLRATVTGRAMAALRLLAMHHRRLLQRRTTGSSNSNNSLTTTDDRWVSFFQTTMTDDRWVSVFRRRTPPDSLLEDDVFSRCSSLCCPRAHSLMRLREYARQSLTNLMCVSLCLRSLLRRHHLSITKRRASMVLGLLLTHRGHLCSSNIRNSDNSSNSIEVLFCKVLAPDQEARTSRGGHRPRTVLVQLAREAGTEATAVRGSGADESEHCVAKHIDDQGGSCCIVAGPNANGLQVRKSLLENLDLSRLSAGLTFSICSTSEH